MTPHERQLLERFLADMVGARAGQKDPDAEALIRDAASRQPDAVYLLVQRAIQLDQALQLTNAEVQRLQEELAQARADGNNAGGSFLGDPYRWGARPASAPSQQAQQSQQPQQPQQAQQWQPSQQPSPVAAQPQMAPRPMSGGWGGSSMLGTVATTAAGVVAGSFLFQGIQNLMHHNDPPAGGHHAADTQGAQPLVGNSAGFDDVVPDDSDLLAAGEDDSDSV